MPDDKFKPPVSHTQFGELRESHSTLEGKHEELKHRLGKQDEQLQKLEFMGRVQGKQLDNHAKELLSINQSANRIEAKQDKLGERSEDLLEAFDVVKKGFTLLEWVVKRLLPVLVGLGTLAAWWAGAFKGH
jgi:chromosome segregation ATPase